jgi:uncharacterized protein YjbI with pentapeptide repeats
MAKRKKAELAIVDIFGQVMHRAHVLNPAEGLRGADLSGLHAPYGQLQGLDLSGALLYAAKLRNADLSFAILTAADLRGAALDRAMCKGTRFRNADLSRDNLNARTTLYGTDLSTADLHGAKLDGAVYDDDTKFPKGFSPAAHGMLHVGDLPPGDLHRP